MRGGACRNATLAFSGNNHVCSSSRRACLGTTRSRFGADGAARQGSLASIRLSTRAEIRDKVSRKSENPGL